MGTLHAIDWSKDLYDTMQRPEPPSPPPSQGLITPHRLVAMRHFMQLRIEWENEVQWASQIGPPPDSVFFAREAAYVIVNSGMRAQIAWKIWERVRERLAQDLPVANSGAFGHPGKTKAIDQIWRDKADLYRSYMALTDDAARLDFLGDLPWIGDITRYHLAKNFGVMVAKPDRWLVRVAELHGLTVEQICFDLAEATGYSVPLVDTIIWRCCNLGAVSIESDGIRPVDPWLACFWVDADLNEKHGHPARKKGQAAP